MVCKPAQLLQNRHFAENNFRGVDENCLQQKTLVAKSVCAVEKWNVGDHLKRIFPKFEADRSHPRGVNGRSKFRQFFFVEKWNVGDHLKRVFPKFEAVRSHPRGVNGRSKLQRHARICMASVFFQQRHAKHLTVCLFSAWKSKVWDSSQMHFGIVSCWTEPSLRSKV